MVWVNNEIKVGGKVIAAGANAISLHKLMASGRPLVSQTQQGHCNCRIAPGQVLLLCSEHLNKSGLRDPLILKTNSIPSQLQN